MLQITPGAAKKPRGLMVNRAVALHLWEWDWTL